MSEFKSLLTIVGTTHSGKTRALLSAARDYAKTRSDGEIIAVIVNEGTALSTARMFLDIGMDVVSSAVAAQMNKEFPNLHFIHQDDAIMQLEDFDPEKVSLFIDCVSDTSLSVDEHGLFVSFYGSHSADLYEIAAMGTLRAVTASNWGK